MAQTNKLDYRLLPSFIASTLSVLKTINNNFQSIDHAIDFAFYLTD